jgi:hypothetical protein
LIFFKLRLLLRESCDFRGWQVAFWVAFFGLGLVSGFALRLWDGRIATFHVDSMVKLLSVMGALSFSALFHHLIIDSFYMISALLVGHGKSPCFLQVAFLRVVSPDYPVLDLRCIDGAKFSE